MSHCLLFRPESKPSTHNQFLLDRTDTEKLLLIGLRHKLLLIEGRSRGMYEKGGLPGGLHSCAILTNAPMYSGKSSIDKSDVAHITLSQFPIISDDTKIENIIEFKKDSDNSERLISLRVWMSEIAKGNLSLFDADEQLQLLLRKYENALKFYEIKFTHGVVKTIILTIAEALENVIKLKFGEAAKTFFSIQQNKIELLEQERQAPGREVSYITKVKEQFGR